MMGDISVTNNRGLFTFEQEAGELPEIYRTKNERIRIIIDSMNEGMIAVDNRFIITEVNAMSCYIWETRRDSLIGKNLYDLFDMPSFRKNIAHLTSRSKRHVRFELEIHSPVERSLSVSASRIGRNNGYVLILQDITDEKKMTDLKDEYLGILSSEFKTALEELEAAHLDLNEAYLDTIQRLVMAAEYKDEDTGAHIVRMSQYSALIAEKLGLPSAEVKNILYAAPMHDVGKIGIPDSILMKPGKLTIEEFNIMKNHTTIGAKILADSKAKILQTAQKIAISHHEKWNGRGYPQGLSGDKIPIVGRIAAVADVFDGLTSKRPYKDPYPTEVAVDIIRKERGEHFDPDVADVFINNLEEILRIKTRVDSHENVSLSDFVFSERDNEDGLKL
ncbi:HD domain-containing protein [Desulfobacterales bacterium HSG2]|nr:HD domain-containing protein [Desulfobacterales bacterium HSG2]